MGASGYSTIGRTVIHDVDPTTTKTDTALTSNSQDQAEYYSSYLKSFSSFYSPIHVPVLISICVFGTLCNVANVCVLTRRNMIHSPTNLLLTGLSVAQLFLLINLLLHTLFMIADDNDCILWTKTYAGVAYLLLNVNLNVLSHTIALVHTTSLAVFRYLAIGFPTMSHWYSWHRAKMASIGTYILVPLACTSFYFNSEIQAYQITVQNCSFLPQTQNLKENAGAVIAATQHQFNLTAYRITYTSNKFLLKFNFWFFSTACKLLPCLCLTILSLLLLMELNRLQNRRQKFRSNLTNYYIDNVKNGIRSSHMGSITSMTPTLATTNKNSCCTVSITSQWDPRHVRVTFMLIIVVLLFVLVEAPQGFIYLLSGLGYDLKEMHGYVADLFDVLTVFYSSINFVIYCAMSSEFRKTFNELFLRGSGLLEHNNRHYATCEPKAIKLRVLQQQAYKPVRCL